MKPFITEQELTEHFQALRVPASMITAYVKNFHLGLQGDSDQLMLLAGILHDEEQYGIAHRLYMQAAKFQNAEAIYMLGNYYFAGFVGEENEQKAFEAYERAANLGHADAMNNLADMYLNGEGTEIDEQLAMKWFKKAAEKGVIEAMFTLGMMHEQGIGTKVDEQTALNYYESAALGGDPEAMYRMGSAYMTPLLGLRQNIEKAIMYFEQAAALMHVDSIYNLAYMYETGIDVEVNGEKALFYYVQAAELDDMTSIHAVIRLSSEGNIVPRNEVLAKKWSNYLKQFA